MKKEKKGNHRGLAAGPEPEPSTSMLASFSSCPLSLVYEPSKDELDGHWSCLLSSSEDGEDACVKIKGENAESSCEVAGDTYVNIEGENHNNEKAQENANGKDNDDEKHSCSDASAGEIGWQDVDGEFDENLEKRIEDFIAKVNKGWREEMLRDQ
ncbi:unnamed protein product [Dovyalis caffra]|uniref:Uncharacterized protein n=1 Tax=Dovyalis caffra TaxID=77055 RepID=A0AAV1SRJ6_9ROSI|nr:unnamed protein product [Dovyalis caffra]